MKIVSFSETQNDLRTVLDLAEKDVVTVLHENGKPLVVLTLEDYNGLVETSHLLSSPVNAKHLAQSLADLKARRVVELELTELSDDHAQPPLHK